MAEPGMSMAGSAGTPVMGVDPSGLAQHLKLDAAGGQYVPGLRPFLLTGTVTFGQTSYATNTCAGGLITMAGLPAGVIARSGIFRVKMPFAAIWTGTATGLFFTANPTLSTYTDNVAQSLNAADVAKAMVPVNQTIPSSGTGGVAELVFSPTGGLLTDVNGQLYLAIIAGGNPNTLGAAGTYPWTFDGQY